MELYKIHPQHYVAVDCVILGYQDEEIKLLLYPRSFEPYKGKWSLLGGFVQDNESADEAAARILKQTTGLEQIFLEQVASFSEPNRDPEARVISLAYYALIRIDLHDEEKVKDNGAYWVSISKLPNLIFDHQQMFEKALVKLQQKAGYSLCGHELLPERFTLIQLRKLYEAIFRREFDPGNFRKKMLSLDVLEKLKEKDVSESRKGAFYYRVKEGWDEKDSERIVKL
ncbi:MAG: DNA mismatch repair protein MutT [Bacteroidetes bacterium GWB2_41_8]|nr:MAG: DNA mismatch repair protein MutT [Bacteroidetes bacterium GWB2_41_8]